MTVTEKQIKRIIKLENMNNTTIFDKEQEKKHKDVEEFRKIKKEVEAEELEDISVMVLGLMRKRNCEIIDDIIRMVKKEQKQLATPSAVEHLLVQLQNYKKEL